MLTRFLPNIEEPSSKVRRLRRTSCVRLYGAPVWVDDLAADRRSQAIMASALRLVAARVKKCYRTVSHTVTTVLAGIPPLDLQALEYNASYLQVSQLKGRGFRVNPIPDSPPESSRHHQKMKA